MVRSHVFACACRALALVAVVTACLSAGGPVEGQGVGDAKAPKIVGPDGGENSCSNCHKSEIEAWQNTRHYATFNDRHRSERAQVVLKNMGQRSMKRGQNTCRQCHYTSIVREGEVTPAWGVSCESCHNPGADWNAIHNRPGGNPSADALKWGAGKAETPAARAARLEAAAAKGMLHQAMTYDIATNCFSCHTVPNEELVNKGDHVAGSEFDLVQWSQGEVRHNFASSPGAPDTPTNRPAPPSQLRRLHIVGALVDLEVSLRNLAAAKQPGGAFQKAMAARVTDARKKVDAILKAVPIPDVAAAVGALPATVAPGTAVSAQMADKLGAATKQWAARADGNALGAVDSLIPKTVRGKVHRP